MNEHRFIRYQHWPDYNPVAVREDLKGRHREHCMCYSCNRFFPNDHAKNCPIANELYQVCVKHGVTSPVWECIMFSEGIPNAEYPKPEIEKNYRE